MKYCGKPYPYCIQCIIHFSKNKKCDGYFAKQINLNDLIKLINENNLTNFDDIKEYNKNLYRKIKINKIINIYEKT